MNLGDQIQILTVSSRRVQERFLSQEFDLRPMEAVNPAPKKELEEFEQTRLEQLLESLIMILYSAHPIRTPGLQPEFWRIRLRPDFVAEFARIRDFGLLDLKRANKILPLIEA
jgi:hypothetical protein